MKRRLRILSVIYFLTVAFFSTYWATNFSNYIEYKGDELFIFAVILLVLTIAFYLTIQFVIKRRDFLLALTLPFLICVATFISGGLILLLTNASVIPRQYILTYSGLYLSFSILSVYRLWGRTQKNI